jgi:hypothetical protein
MRLGLQVGRVNWQFELPTAKTAVKKLHWRRGSRSFAVAILGVGTPAANEFGNVLVRDCDSSRTV